MQDTRAIVCEGCEQRASILRELEIHVVHECYARVWLCEACLDAAGVGRIDPPFFCGFVTDGERAALKLPAPN